MKIKQFKSKNLNGYLNFNLKFGDSISFLIGINGSGKTSVLKAMIALISPDADWLTAAEYDQVAIVLEHDKKRIGISATKQEKGVRVEFSSGGEKVSQTISPEIIARAGQIRHRYEYDDDGELIAIGEVQSDIIGLPVFDRIQSLPTPIFLGLDRSSLPSVGNGNRDPRRAARAGRRPHATLRTFLDESVSEAEGLATRAVRSANLSRSRLAGKLREDVLLSLFSSVKEQTIGLPRPTDIKRFEETRRSIKSAFRFVGIEQGLIDKTIDPFFSEVIQTAITLAGNKDRSGYFNQESPAGKAFYSWIELAPRLVIISRIESLVNKFNLQEAEIFERIRMYEHIMNGFFVDSTKKLTFKEDGSLYVRLPSEHYGNVFHLSSGERQLFVLITSLMFNEEASHANLVIIDEPELSLHIRWQESFVDALEAANKDAQIILATHSPSIIYDREEYCVELG